VLNAANEAAVSRFLAGTLPFVDISEVCLDVMDAHEFLAQPTLAELMAADAWARQEVARW
jgi:1-deoxy-D-xylulose-5-phosphate reductoisomerase